MIIIYDDMLIIIYDNVLGDQFLDRWGQVVAQYHDTLIVK